MVFPCSLCPCVASNYRRITRHHRQHHPDDPIRCFYCFKRYRLVNSLYQHIRRYHSGLFIDGALDDDANDEIDALPDNNQNQNFDRLLEVTQDDIDIDDAAVDRNEERIDLGHDDHEMMDIDENHNAEGDDANETLNLHFEITKFLASLKERHHVYGTACVAIVVELEFLLKKVQSGIVEKITQLLTASDVARDDITGMKQYLERLEAGTDIHNVCCQLDSQNDFEVSMNEYFPMVKPVEYVLGQDEAGKDLSVVHVPISETLRDLMQHDDVFAEVQSPHTSQDGWLRDVCDGTHLDQYPFFRERNLQIILYYDEFTMTDGLSSTAKEYKVAGVYFTLANIDPKYRSALKLTFMAAMFKSSVVKKFGIDDVLSELLQDLKTLETEGFEIVRPEGNFKFYGSLLCVVADNLAAHTIAGFKEGFTALRPCRICFITRADLLNRVNLVEDARRLRTISIYVQQAELVEQNPALSTDYGINRNSSLNELNNYHVVGGTPSDLAHDILEGVVGFVLECVLPYLHRQRIVTLPELNVAMATFQASPCDSGNRPSSLPETLAEFEFKKTASQTWFILRMLPLFIGERVPRDDSKWKLLMKLAVLVECLYARKMKVGHIQYIQELISEFLQQFAVEFPDFPMRPKMHHLTHYGGQMKKFGPLVNCNTIRFEAKHSYFKTIGHFMKNRRNVTKTLATRHQRLQSLIMKEEKILTSSTRMTRKQLLPTQCLPEPLRASVERFTGSNSIIVQAENLYIDTVRYGAGMALVLDVDSDLPTFSRMVSCLEINGLKYFRCSELETTHYDSHVNGYTVIDTGREHLVSPGTWADHEPLGIYPVGDEYVVVLKYRIF